MSDFLKQANEPAFPKIFWNKPVSRKAAKSLLIIGGHAKQFSGTQTAYQAALAAGIGEAKVVLPDSLRKFVGPLPDAILVPSSKSGSIAKIAAADIIAASKAVDSVLFADELSHNSETISLVEQLLTEISKPVILSQTVIEIMLYNPQVLFTLPQRLLLAPIQTLVKLASKLGVSTRVQAGENLFNKIDVLEQLRKQQAADYVLLGNEAVVASQNQVSLTAIENWNDELAALAAGIYATFWLQHTNHFEALTTASFVLSRIGKFKDGGITIALKNLGNILSEYSQ